jgi:hypothetical protein
MSIHRTREQLVRQLATVREEEARLEERIAAMPMRPHSIGNRYTRAANGNGEPYILAQVGRNAFALVSLRSGNRWSDAYTVDDFPGYGHGLTDPEFLSVAGNTEFFKVLR